MQIKERTVWRVSSGDTNKWFAGEIGARDYASDRFNDVDGPIPFVEQITLSELLARVNELESATESRVRDVYV